MSVTSVRNWLVFLAALPFVVGCTESTTQKDVADARKEVVEQQKDAAEARHEAMKPAIDDDAAEKIQKEDADVAKAQADLNQTEQKAAATQARDSFALEAQKALDAADREIDALKTQAGGEEGAAKDATQQKIDDLKTRRDRLDDSLGKLKRADLLKWTDHRAEVQTAMKELTSKLNDRR